LASGHHNSTSFCGRFAALIVGQVLFAIVVSAATPTPELQKLARTATFEVVIRKSENDKMSYERPLPLDLIPYAQRKDAYWPIGTAFSIAHATYVSAGHVMLMALGNSGGTPAIRDSAGQIYTVDRVLKFSMREDFMVFTVTPAPATSPLPTRNSAEVDEPVYAVGNALGEGVVIRDGLLTSMTPEEQDGEWKWLRFSAPTSPGNSGGPLLDANGRVLGVVLAKSPSENLNYALPIERVLSGSEQRAVIDVRAPFRLPILHETIVAPLKSDFPLPLPYGDFAATINARLLQYYREQKAAVLTSHADSVVPRGDSAKLLAAIPIDTCAIASQQDDSSWELTTDKYGNDTDLPDGGYVWTGAAFNTTMFLLRRPASAIDDNFYTDARVSMDMLLKGMKLPRIVATESVRITTLGPAQSDIGWQDRFARRWQIRIWSMDFINASVVAFELPVPDGYAGLLRVTPTAALDTTIEEMKLLADYYTTAYAGTFREWRGFLTHKDLRPAIFDRISLDTDMTTGVHYRSQRLVLHVPAQMMRLDDESVVQLRMAFSADHDRLVWDVGAVYIYRSRASKTFVGVIRQPKPGNRAGPELLDRWRHLSSRDGEFGGTRGHDSNWTTYWMRSSASAPSAAGGFDAAAGVLYELVSQQSDSRLPAMIDDMHDRLTDAVRIIEH
jgi:hypothetical protein